MSDIKIARRAFGDFYGTSFSVIVDANLYERIADNIPDTLAIFILREDNVIDIAFDVGAEATPQTQQLDLAGMVIGLKAIIVGKGREAAANLIVEHARRQGMYQLPETLTLSRMDLFWNRRPAAFIATLLARQLKIQQEQLGTAQQQISSLRGRYERLWLSFEKARRMIKGVGYSLRSISFSLEPGSEVVEPPADGITHKYSQILPTDLSGFTGVNVFVDKASADDCDGTLTVRVTRLADHMLIGETVIAFTDISRGWLACSFGEAIPLTHGDGVLEVIWTGYGGPSLSLANIDADRFGDDSGRSLALQVEKGLADPTLEPASTPADNPPREQLAFSGSVLVKAGHYVGGEAAFKTACAALDHAVVSFDKDEGWLQTHLLEKNVVAWRATGLLDEHSAMLKTRCKSAHEMMVPSLYVLIAVSAGTTDEEVEKLLSDIGKGENKPLEGHDDKLQAVWKAVTLSPLEEETIELELSSRVFGCDDVVLAALPLDSNYAYGHARWLELVVAREQKVRLESTSERLREAGRQNVWQIRPHRLSEIAGQISFYQGHARLAAIASELGFSPMTFSEDTGALQAHPFNGQISAGIMAHGMPVGALRLSCEVGTAHALAPEFTYILAVIPEDAEDKAALVEAISGRVVAGEMHGHDAALGLHWSAQTLEALEVSTLALEFFELSDKTADVVFAVVPTAGSDSYAWCRWYSYEVAIGAASGTFHTLDRAAEGQVKAPVSLQEQAV